MVTRPLVSVVDDDESVRESLPDLLREFGFRAQAFSSAEEFLASDVLDHTRCLVLDIAMPGMSGAGSVRRPVHDTRVNYPCDAVHDATRTRILRTGPAAAPPSTEGAPPSRALRPQGARH